MPFTAGSLTEVILAEAKPILELLKELLHQIFRLPQLHDPLWNAFLYHISLINCLRIFLISCDSDCFLHF